VNLHEDGTMAIFEIHPLLRAWGDAHRRLELIRACPELGLFRPLLLSTGLST
jgi:hypothetical protein